MSLSPTVEGSLDGINKRRSRGLGCGAYRADRGGSLVLPCYRSTARQGLNCVCGSVLQRFLSSIMPFSLLHNNIILQISCSVMIIHQISPPLFSILSITPAMAIGTADDDLTCSLRLSHSTTRANKPAALRGAPLAIAGNPLAKLLNWFDRCKKWAR